VHLAGLQGSCWLSIAVGTSLYFMGGEIIRVWTHGQVPMNRALFIWLLLAAAISAFWHVSLTVIQAMNLHLRAAIYDVLGGIIVVALSWVLIHITGGIAGAGLALLIGDGLFAMYVFVAAARLTQTPVGATIVYMLNPVALYRSMMLSGIPMRFMNTLRRGFR
jgi:O-antigen/teichoic acid export membrane protein